MKKEKERKKEGEKKQFFLERGSIQNNEKLSDNGKEDSSGKGGTRRKKGYQRFSFSLGVRRKKKEKANGEKTAKKLWNRKTPKRKKPQLIGQQQRAEGETGANGGCKCLVSRQ